MTKQSMKEIARRMLVLLLFVALGITAPQALAGTTARAEGPK